MNIYQAAHKAVKENKYIARPTRELGKLVVKIKLSNNPSKLCEVHLIGGSKKPAPYWNPSADDLLADDWQIID